MFSLVSEKIHQVSQKIYTFKKEERLLRIDNDDWEYFIKQKTKILQRLSSLIDLIKVKDHSFEMNITTNPIYNKLQFLNPKKKQFGEDLLLILQNDETLIIKLKMLILEIEDETKELKQSGSFWNCIRCNTILKEGYNEETCIFHSGQLKYFSCKTCGGDEYFTCCNQCRDCNQGCRKGLHKP
ncbi:unnamed protein product [Paramecium pentaurelia]|uniref:Uncharacterized protein n=1 Tax=Paramecium pentaurelia TaxID=43138 RepID=A0A8S1U2P5_9CILI|nr:unnamed protein product [Paramecium pentaurelia]